MSPWNIVGQPEYSVFSSKLDKSYSKLFKLTHEVNDILFMTPDRVGEVELYLEGRVLLSSDWAFNWKEKHIHIQSNVLTIQNGGRRKKKIKKIFFSFLYPIPIRKDVKAIKLFCENKKAYDIMCCEGSVEEWASELENLWPFFYTVPLLTLKSNTALEYKKLVEKAVSVSRKYYEERAYFSLENKNFSKYLDRKGTLTLVMSTKRKFKQNYTVYVESYRFCMQLKQMVGEEKKVTKDIIVFKFASIGEEVPEDPRAFKVLVAPHHAYIFRTKNLDTQQLWVDCLRNAIAQSHEASQNTFLGDDINVFVEDLNTPKYFYSKSLKNRMYLLVPSNGEQQIKLRNGKSWVIGRSSENYVQLSWDHQVSRAHCKIELLDNIPYLIDLGSSLGTWLEGKKITRSPLKPNDMIKVGNSEILFMVKDEEIFFQYMEGDVNQSSIGEKESTCHLV